MKLFSSLGNFYDSFTGLFRKDGLYTRGIATNYLIGQSGAVWIPVEELFNYYNTIPQLKAIIDRKALMFANMDLKLESKETDEEIEDAEFYKLISMPNVTQGMNEWLIQYKQQEQVYGNQFMYKNKPSNVSKYPVALWNISPRYVKPYLTGKMFDQINIDEIISHYEYTENNSVRRFDGKDIMYSRLTSIDNPVIGVSPLYALQYPISNIKAAYEYRNVIMTEKGGIGMLSNESKDSMGAIPMSKEEKERIENQYRKDYGIGRDQMRVILTEASLKWTPMTYPTRDLLLFEEVDANTLSIIDAFGLNANLFSNKNSTFENVRNSIVQTYQDTIMPEADKFTQKIGKFLNIPENQYIEACYEHLSIFKEDENNKASTLKTKVDSITQLVNSNIITPSQAQLMLLSITDIEVDTTTGAKGVIEKLTDISPLLANNMLRNLTTNEIRSAIGLPNIDGGDRLQSVNQTQGFNG